MQGVKLPAEERGHKQLGRAAAVWHLLQLQLLFILCAWTTLAPTDSPWHARVLLATSGLAYSYEASA